MSDNIVLVDGSGTLLASDDVDGVQVLRVKLQTGSPGTAADVCDDTPLPVQVRAPPLAIYRKVGLQLSPQVAKDSAGLVLGWHLANSGTLGVFVSIYDTASAWSGTAPTPVLTLFVPAGSTVSSEHPDGIQFTNGITVAAITTDNESPSAGKVTVALFYRDPDALGAVGSGVDPSTLGVVTPDSSTLAKRDGAGKLFALGFDAGAERVTGVGAPTADADAATKGYVDQGLGAQRCSAVAGVQATSNEAPTVVGGFSYDPSATHNGERTIKLEAVLMVSAPGVTATLKLWDQTAGAYVSACTLTSTSVGTPERKSSAALGVPADLANSLHVYVVHLYKSGGTVNDTAVCLGADLLITFA